MKPSELPIYELSDALQDAVASRRLVIQAPTGSGKSTQVPQMLPAEGGQVLVLQPRRIAARLLAKRVAWERGVELGGEVGYQIRFEDRSGPETRIKFITEGILLRQVLNNPTLAGISAVVFDEFHERHLFTDISLARALQIQQTTRPDLLIVVMSATLDTALLQQFLDPCTVLRSEGRTFPVEVEYLPPKMAARDRPVWEQAAEVFSQAAASGLEGDVLVFMPGGYEIRRTVAEFGRCKAAKGALILPLYGELPPEEQDRAIAQYDRRKIVVATNVAETSLTIDGVRLVIDSGLARIPAFDAHRGINTLNIEKISQASAEQRAGRAGRTAPGHCFRLWSEREHKRRPERELPEIRRVDLAETLLTLKAGGIADLSAFQWLEAPDPKVLARAERLLVELDAVEPEDNALTEIGRAMLAWPVHPRYGRILAASREYGCTREAALIAAIIHGRPILLRKQDRRVIEKREDKLGLEPGAASDLELQMKAWYFAERNRFQRGPCAELGIHAEASRQVGRLFKQFLDLARRNGLDVDGEYASAEALGKCLLTGLSDQVALRRDQGSLRCRLVGDRRAELSRDCVVRDHALMAVAEVQEIEGRERNVLITMAHAVEEGWLQDLFPMDFVAEEETVFDERQRRAGCRSVRKFRDLVLEERAAGEPSLEVAARLLAREVQEGRLNLKSWDKTVEAWIMRINCLAAWCPELEIARIGEEERLMLLEQLCHGSISYKQIKNADVWPVLKSWLNPAQAGALEHFAPERYKLPGGRQVKIHYEEGKPPVLGARIADLYDVTGQILLANGTVPVLFHVQGPHHRPLHICDDLTDFWTEHYPKMKQELQRRYPKHEWR